MIKLIGQAFLKLTNLGGILLLLKGVTQRAHALIACCLGVLDFFTQEAIRRLLQRKFTFLKTSQNLGDELSHLN